ncbi:hypothetical protein FLAVO9AF_540032 [Flavobacterium sp. 9AF]|nr:hypothetical protein FLAVO9AF_540032 [Flavobacterium sp. 9AF]
MYSCLNIKNNGMTNKNNCLGTPFIEAIESILQKKEAKIHKKREIGINKLKFF